MAPIKSFRDLLVWQKAIDLAVRCHQMAKGFPRDETDWSALSNGAVERGNPNA
jgi:hypothetical protein